MAATSVNGAGNAVVMNASTWGGSPADGTTCGGIGGMHDGGMMGGGGDKGQIRNHSDERAGCG